MHHAERLHAVYNDGYRPILGSIKHPAAMGISTRDTFSGSGLSSARCSGIMEKPTTVVDFMLPLATASPGAIIFYARSARAGVGGSSSR
jgi:hypothetical protein